MDVLAVHWQSHQPLLHKMMGESQTQGFPFLQTFIEWFQALGKKRNARLLPRSFCCGVVYIMSLELFCSLILQASSEKHTLLLQACVEAVEVKRVGEQV